MDISNNGYLKQWISQTMDFSNNGFLKQWISQTMDISNNGYLKQWISQTMDISNNAYLKQWISQTMDISNNGYLKQWISQTMDISNTPLRKSKDLTVRDFSGCFTLNMNTLWSFRNVGNYLPNYTALHPVVSICLRLSPKRRGEVNCMCAIVCSELASNCPASVQQLSSNWSATAQ